MVVKGGEGGGLGGLPYPRLRERSTGKNNVRRGIHHLLHHPPARGRRRGCTGRHAAIPARRAAAATPTRPDGPGAGHVADSGATPVGGAVAAGVLANVPAKRPEAARGRVGKIALLASARDAPPAHCRVTLLLLSSNYRSAETRGIFGGTGQVRGKSGRGAFARCLVRCRFRGCPGVVP